jgi:peptidoglycan/xylan/chitin deacetylase (PgdA/CDA1 family)
MSDSKRNVKFAISLAYFVITSLCNFFLFAVGQSRRGRLTILYYHGISPENKAAFARQMQSLRNRAKVLPASYRGTLPGHKNAVAITFDDAFVSVLENALPEIVSCSFCCTIFVPAGQLGQHPTWAVEADSRERDELVMTSEQLKQLPVEVVMLGSHSISHPHLSQLSSEQSRAEIESSKRILADVTGRDVRLFAFPYGDHTPAVIELCRSAGYDLVFTINPISVNTEGSEFVRGRVKVEPHDGTFEFFLKSNGAYGWMSYVSRIKQKFHRLCFS